jgi:16S rRNA C967 or C1407 C5-methylase (RsmB/RsmF family)
MTFENPFSTRPLRIPTLSSAYPAKEVWEERTSPLGSKDRGSCQLLTTVAPSLRLPLTVMAGWWPCHDVAAAVAALGLEGAPLDSAIDTCPADAEPAGAVAQRDPFAGALAWLVHALCHPITVTLQSRD